MRPDALDYGARLADAMNERLGKAYPRPATFGEVLSLEDAALRLGFDVASLRAPAAAVG